MILTLISHGTILRPGGSTWQTSLDWADALSVTFGENTYDDWRLPSTTQPDPSCKSQNSTGSSGFNCLGSEMGHLYYTELGNPEWNLLNKGDFLSLGSNTYWSSTENAGNTSRAWAFQSGIGSQGSYLKGFYGNAMAVRDGNVFSVAVAPEPVSTILFGIGGAVLGFNRFRNRFKK
ncbi:DUF1566 domain-containing protein [bacterium]|nr:DUF1566 domain-containing protein [bacterium]